MAGTREARAPGPLAERARPRHQVARRAGRRLLLLMAVVSAGILGLVGVLLAWSPGKPKPFVDEDGRPLAGSISEKIHVDRRRHPAGDHDGGAIHRRHAGDDGLFEGSLR